MESKGTSAIVLALVASITLGIMTWAGDLDLSMVGIAAPVIATLILAILVAVVVMVIAIPLAIIGAIAKR